MLDIFCFFEHVNDNSLANTLANIPDFIHKIYDDSKSN